MQKFNDAVSLGDVKRSRGIEQQIVQTKKHKFNEQFNNFSPFFSSLLRFASSSGSLKVFSIYN